MGWAFAALPSPAILSLLAAELNIDCDRSSRLFYSLIYWRKSSLPEKIHWGTSALGYTDNPRRSTLNGLKLKQRKRVKNKLGHTLTMALFQLMYVVVPIGGIIYGTEKVKPKHELEMNNPASSGLTRRDGENTYNRHNEKNFC